MNTNHSPCKEKSKRTRGLGFDANYFLILYLTKEKEVFMILTDMTWTPSATF